MRVFFCIILLYFLFFNNSAFAETDKEKLKKIDDQLISIKKLYENDVLDETTYEDSKQKLLSKKSLIQNKNKTTVKKKNSSDLDKQIAVIDKLYADGILTEDEYLKTKKILTDKDSTKEVIEKPTISPLTVNIKEDPGRKLYEKAEIIFRGYRIYTYRQGGIKVVRLSDNKRLIQITDNLKVKYYNNGESVIETKVTKYTPPNLEEEAKEKIQELKTLGKDILSGKLNIFKKKGAKFDKDAHKLELFIEGIKILHFEGRYVKKYKAFFYQVLTSNFQSFHFYLKLRGKTAIALNMEKFNSKIDRAIRKAKTKLMSEYDITEEQINAIIERETGKATAEATKEAVADAVAAEVEAAIAQSVGDAMSE
nr:SHOCT domain-containing protein [Pelagibacterales bacterium]